MNRAPNIENQIQKASSNDESDDFWFSILEQELSGSHNMNWEYFTNNYFTSHIINPNTYYWSTSEISDFFE
jgi:hypothetical protein